MPRRRRSALLLGMLAAILAATTFVAVGAVLRGGPGGLDEAGPPNPANGFPDWYRDSKGVALEPCLDVNNPRCLVTPDMLARPDQPVSFPDNFPDEFFYWNAVSEMLTNGGANRARLVLALEGAFANGAPAENDQIVFGRVRFVVGGLRTGQTYTFTHPQGQDTVVPEDSGPRGVFFSEDIGVSAGNFDEVLRSRVGPFLEWTPPTAADPAVPPPGYLGDPNVLHTVTGSPHDTNFFRITGPEAAGPPGATNPNPCPTTGPHAWTGPENDCIQSDLFALQAKLSTRGGVSVDSATYSRDVSGASRKLDVLARSKSAQNLVLQDQDNGPARRFPATALKGGTGSRYFAHVDVDAAPGAPAPPTVPDVVDVRNRSDVPETVKHMPVKDRVRVTSAVYHTDTDTLSVTAESSDKYDDGAGPVVKLSLPQYGAQQLTGGAGDVTGLDAPPASVKVVSTKGGSDARTVDVTGPGLPGLPLTAVAGPDQSVEQTTTVKLDAGASSGSIDSYHWDAPAGITLSDPNAVSPTFTAPSLVPNTDTTDLTFTLTLNGVGGPKTDDVIVHVLPVTPPVAHITADPAALPAFPSVPQNMPMTLDGTTSTGAARFSWVYNRGLGDPELGDPGPTNDSKFTFTMPKTSRTLSFRLTVTNPQGDTSEALVALTPQPDDMVMTRARFVPATKRWTVDGTVTSLVSNSVTVHSGPTLNGPVIGTSPVDALGVWSVDVLDSTVPLPPCNCVSAESARGGSILAFDLATVITDPAEPPHPTEPPAPSLVPPPPLAPAPAPLAPATLGRAAIGVPVTITAARARDVGVPVTITVPPGAAVARVRVLTMDGQVLFSTFRSVKTTRKAMKLWLHDKTLRRKLRKGKQYVVEVRPGITRTKLGRATRQRFTIGQH